MNESVEGFSLYPGVKPMTPLSLAPNLTEVNHSHPLLLRSASTKLTLMGEHPLLWS